MAVRTSKQWVAGYPQLVAEWHPTKNIDLYPHEVRYASNLSIWWKCKKGPDHEWRASANVRTRSGAGVQPCPFCSGRRVSITNSLATIAPELARQLHPTRNGALNARSISSKSSKTVWWRCPAGPRHVYPSQVSARVQRGIGCPFCARKRLAPEHTLAHVAPAIARRWHPAKNGSLTPSTVSARSAGYAWFVCASKARHAFRTKIKRMVDDDRCSYCEGWEVAPDTSLAALHPELAAEWHKSRNGARTPEKVSPHSAEDVWWRCPAGRNHVYRASIHDRAMRGRGCPFCSGRRLSVTNTLAARFPKLAKEWHPTKNGALRPSAVLATSPQTVWWKCGAGPDHVWHDSVRHRTRTITHCPFCRGHRLSVTNSLAGRFPELAREWHPRKNGKLTPHDVRWGERRKVWWRCGAGPDHEWEATIPYRTAQGGRCPFCIGKRLSVTNSFGAKYPALAREWHSAKNGGLDPFHVHATSKTYVWWRCRKALNHSWRTRLVQRTMAGTGCPFCARRPR
jgi:hypothetical protein